MADYIGGCLSIIKPSSFYENAGKAEPELDEEKKVDYPLAVD